MARKEFAGAAAPLTLEDAITAGSTTITVTGTVTGWPAGVDPFVIEIDRGVAGAAEKILIQSRSGSTLTVAGGGRGYDGTTAQSHSEGATVEHVVDAGTVDEANAHVNDTSRDDHTQYLDTTRHDTTARHPFGDVIATGVPGAIAPGDSASEGVANSGARSDHQHAMPDWGDAGDITQIEPGDTAVAGSSGKFADASHQHAMPGYGAAGLISAVEIGDSAAQGSTGAPADAGHVHSMGTPGTPIASNPGDTGGAGVSTTPARSDHVHPRETFPNVTEVTEQDISDIAVGAGGSDTIIAKTFTVGTGGRLAHIEFNGDVRRQSAGAEVAFAGNAQIQVDGADVGQRDRYDSKSRDSVLSVNPTAWTELTAGSHVVSVLLTCDPGSDTAIYAYDRFLVVGLIGGA